MCPDLKPYSSFGVLRDGPDGFCFAAQVIPSSVRTFPLTSYFYWLTVSPSALPSALFRQLLKFGTLLLLNVAFQGHHQLIIASCLNISDRINMSGCRDAGILLWRNLSSLPSSTLSCQTNALVSRIASNLGCTCVCSLALAFLVRRWWGMLTLRVVEILPVTALSRAKRSNIHVYHIII